MHETHEVVGDENLILIHDILSPLITHMKNIRQSDDVQSFNFDKYLGPWDGRAFVSVNKVSWNC